jgi:hypothetical protein
MQSSQALAAEKSLAIGEKVESLNFKDVWFLPRSLDDFAKRDALVIVFTALDSPRAEVYLPLLEEMALAYEERNVQFLAMNVGPDDSIRDTASQALKYQMSFPFVKDFDAECATRLGINQTMAVVVLDNQRRLSYRGRIDDRFSIGQTAGQTPSGGQQPAGAQQTAGTQQREPTQHDLKRALDSILSGDKVKQPEVAVTGQAIGRPTPPKLEPGIKVTYARHIAPLMARHCQECHRPGTEAPFSLLTYQDVIDHVDMIGEVVAEERMPPWFASLGEFDNSREMTREEQALVRLWIEQGMVSGDLSQAPEVDPQRVNPRKWIIDEPDLVITTRREHKLPADGFIPYKYVMLPHRFEHDTWVQQIEILPDNPRVVHHCNMAYVLDGDWNDAKFVIGKVPGVQPMNLSDNVAYKIPKGAMMILQIHYTSTGQPETCKISAGFRYAREVVHKEFKYLWMVNNTFAIPPGDPAHRVSATNTLDCNAIGVGLFAHMHLRGKDMSFVAHYPDGRSERLLEIPNYSFDWQLAYRWNEQGRRFPSGTKFEAISHYDNSTFNPYNPDPTQTVREGQQTIHEMLNGVFFYMDADEHLNLKIDPTSGKVLGSGDEPNPQASKAPASGGPEGIEGIVPTESIVAKPDVLNGRLASDRTE